MCVNLQVNFPGGSEGKVSACNVADLVSILGLGRFPGEGNGKPTPVLLPGKSHGRRSLVGYTVHGVANSWTRLSDFTFTFHFHALEKEMATHSSVLAWRIPWTEEPGTCSSVHGIRYSPGTEEL